MTHKKRHNSFARFLTNRITISALAFCIFTSSSHALNEQEFIQNLLNNQAFFEKERINLSIKAIEMEGDRATYADWAWDLSAQLGRINKSKDKLNYTSSYDYAKSSNQSVRKINTDLSKKFFSNGSELSIGYDKSWPIKDEQMHDKNGYQEDKNTTEYLDDIQISWTLPLLKNAGGVVDQKTYDLAVLDYEDEKLVLHEAKEDFIEEKLMIFIDWSNYKAQIDLVTERLLRAEKMLKSMQNQNVKRSDLLTFERSINKSKRQLFDLESKLKAEQKALSVLLKDINIDDNPLELDWTARTPLIDDLSNYCQNSIRDIQRIKIEKLKNKRYLKTYRNSQLPELDFTITASRDDDKGNYTSTSKTTETEYEAKLEFSYPLSGDIANQVYLDKYQLKHRQLELKYQDLFDDILADTKKLTTKLKQAQGQLDLINQQIDTFGWQKSEDELALFLKGEGSIRFVINEQEDFLDLLLERVEVLSQYHQNRVEYNSLLDRLLI